MSATDKIRVLVLGDSGVGKSSLVHLIAHGQPIGSSSWTIGASIEIKAHDYGEGTPSQKTCFIELWDIGGSRGHMPARQVFYNDSSFHGLILVHDSTNSKSLTNLRKWLSEVFADRDNRVEPAFSIGMLFGAPPDEPFDFDVEQLAEKNVPVLVAATKDDQVTYTNERARRYRKSTVAEECKADEIFVDSTQSKSLAPGSTNAVALSRFLDKVVERKYRSSFTQPAFMMKRNAQSSHTSSTLKSSHFD